MIVLSIELLEANKKNRISGGVYIEFESIENVKKGDYFKIVIDKCSYDFKAVEIKVKSDKLLVKAKEVGYWAQKLDRKGVDLRNVINTEVIHVTDQEEIENIYDRSCWC